MIIKNENIKKALIDKKNIVDGGRKLNEEIDKKAGEIADKFMADKGVAIEKGEDKTFYRGTFQQLRDIFATGTMTQLNDLIERELSKELKEIKKLEHIVAKINEKVTDLVEKEVKPLTSLGEFQEFGRIELAADGSIDIEIYDVVEEFKKRYTAKKNAPAS